MDGWLVDYLRFYVPLKNFSLIWKRHHCRWMAAKCRPMLGAQGLSAGGIFIVPHLMWHRTSVFLVSSEGPPHLVSSYNTRGMWRIYSKPDPHGGPWVVVDNTWYSDICLLMVVDNSLHTDIWLWMVVDNSLYTDIWLWMVVDNSLYTDIWLWMVVDSSLYTDIWLWMVVDSSLLRRNISWYTDIWLSIVRPLLLHRQFTGEYYVYQMMTGITVGQGTVL
jgi:hypothetical protein